MADERVLDVLESRKAFAAATADAEKSLFWLCNYLAHGQEAPKTALAEWKAAVAREEKAFERYRKSLKALR